MTTHQLSIIDQAVIQHMISHFDDGHNGFIDQVYSMFNHIDIHGKKVTTFKHGLTVMVDDGFFLVYYSQIVDFLQSMTDEYGHIPYNRSTRPFKDWTNDQLWRFYRSMLIRAGLRYIDFYRRIYCVNYDGHTY